MTLINIEDISNLDDSYIFDKYDENLYRILDNHVKWIEDNNIKEQHIKKILKTISYTDENHIIIFQCSL